MKNNTNQIMKLNIPIWIKYWLSKHKNASYILSEILTGSEFFLQDSAPKKFKKFIPIGRTTQESTSGKQLLEKLINTSKSNGAKYSTDRLSVEVDFAKSSDEYFTICNVESPTTKAYTLAFKASGVKNGETPKYNVDGRTSSIKTLVNGLNVVNIPSGTTIANNHLLFDDQQKTSYPNTSTVTFTDFMLVEGTYTEETMPAYEPYTGGEPAPNPNYKMPIKNTGDNGSVNEKVQNKNFIYDANHNKGTSITQDGITYTVNDDGSISVNGTATANGTYYMIGGNGSQPLTLKPGNYVLSGGISGDAWIRMFDGTNYYDTGSSTIKSFTLNDEINIWVGLRIKSGTTINATFYPQLEIGSTATSYVPHSEQNISFPLAQGQKLYEGDYLADDGVHHVQEQELLDGTQLLSKFLYNSNLSTENYSCFMYDNNRIAQPQNDTDIFVIADKLKGTGSNQRTADIANCWINHLAAGQLGMHVPKSVTTTSELRIYLANNPITFQYKLAEEVIDPYTEEQKEAWEEWKKARTYKNVTHITSSDETPANLKIQYYKEG